jgi:tryptophan synthase alpha subunit
MQSALVTYVTAGFPTAQETPDIMLGMEAGGAGMFGTLTMALERRN